MRKIISEANEGEMLLAAHEFAMSDDASHAAQGRAVKAMMPVVGKWLNGEIDRGTGPVDMMIATNSIMASIFLSSIVFASRGTADDAMVDEALSAAIETLKDAVKASRIEPGTA